MPTRQTSYQGNGSSQQLTRATERVAPQREAATVSFTAPNTISDSANGFTTAAGFAGAPQRIRITGSAKNNRDFQILTRADGTLTVTPGRIVTESAGAKVKIRILP